MKTVIAAILLTGFSAISFAADNVPRAQHFEAKKTEILQRIDQRIARNQEEKSCVQAAANHDALKACRERFRAETKNDHQGKKP